MKKYAPWILIPTGFILLQWLSNATEPPIDLSEPTFSVTDDAEIRFYNIRQLAYDREDRADAKMRLFRYKRRPQGKESIAVQAALVISPTLDKAFIMVEILGLPDRDTVLFRHTYADSTQSFVFGQGTMVEHFTAATWLYQCLQTGGTLSLQSKSGYEYAILSTEPAKLGFQTTAEDFYKLVGLR